MRLEASSPSQRLTQLYIAPVAPIVKYETSRWNLTPIVEGEFVGYGPKVDEAWDRIANSSKSLLFPNPVVSLVSKKLTWNLKWVTP